MGECFDTGFETLFTKRKFFDLKIERYFIHAFEMFLRTFLITDFGTRPAIEIVIFNDFKSSFVRIHTKSRNRISPYRIHFFLKRSCDVHQSGIMRKNNQRLFNQRSGLIEIIFSATVENQFFSQCFYNFFSCFKIFFSPEENDQDN